MARQDGDSLVKQYDATIGEALRLSGPQFKRIFQLDQEPGSLRDAYGGEFGQRCLLARRLVESGVRFIEVSHNLNFLNGTGWDVHNDGILQQHALIQELDKALATLVHRPGTEEAARQDADRRRQRVRPPGEVRRRRRPRPSRQVLLRSPWPAAA